MPITFASENGILELVELTEPPNPGDIVYHDSDGIVQCRVTDSYFGKHRELYPEIVILETIRDYNTEHLWFEEGHLSVRDLSELYREKSELGDPDLLKNLGRHAVTILVVGKLFGLDLRKELAKPIKQRQEIPKPETEIILGAQNRRERRNQKRLERHRRKL